MLRTALHQFPKHLGSHRTIASAYAMTPYHCQTTALAHYHPLFSPALPQPLQPFIKKIENSLHQLETLPNSWEQSLKEGFKKAKAEIEFDDSNEITICASEMQVQNLDKIYADTRKRIAFTDLINTVLRYIAMHPDQEVYTKIYVELHTVYVEFPEDILPTEVQKWTHDWLDILSQRKSPYQAEIRVA